MILENHGQQNKKRSAMFEKITGNVFLNHRQCFVKRWATFFSMRQILQKRIHRRFQLRVLSLDYGLRSIGHLYIRL